MSIQTTQKVRTYKTVTTEPVSTQVFSTRSASPMSPRATVSTVSPVSPLPPLSPIQVASSNVTSLPVSGINGSYQSMRYLIPVQQAMHVPQQPYVLMQQPMVQQTMVQPTMVQPMMQPMYVQTLPRVSNNTHHETRFVFQQNDQEISSERRDDQGTHSDFSQGSSPIKSVPSMCEDEFQEEVEIRADESEVEGDNELNEGSVEIEEVEIVNVIQQKPQTLRTRVSVSEQKEVLEPTKLDTRYFGELLADVYRKNCDIHSYIVENVSKIRRKEDIRDLTTDTRRVKEEVESLIPKGATELTKQQMRYVLQTRFTAENSMRLLLSTFNNLREELLKMSDDIRRLEMEKESLERDLKFKEDQAQQYDSLMEGIRENNKQLQLSLKEATATQRSLESKLTSSRNNDSTSSFKIKELEGRLRSLEKENEVLKQKLAGQASNGSLHLKTEALATHYKEQLETLKRERDEEMEKLRSQISKLQTKITTTTTTTTKSSAESALELKISQLLSRLEQREITIREKEEEIKRLMMERNESSKNITRTVITNKYKTHYPLLGLLNDDYQVTSPVKESKTVVIESSGEKIRRF